MTKTSPPTVKLGAFMLAAGAGVAMLVHAHPEKLRAPAWVAYAGAASLGLAGIVVVAQALGMRHIARWLVCALLGGMTLIPGWIALGSGSRRCSVSTGIRSVASEATCRGAFGFGAAILALMFVAAVRGALRARQAGAADDALA